MKAEIMYFIMFNSKIFRHAQIYLDRVLKEYDLSSGSYPYLFILDENEGISQNKISKELDNDKAMSAKTLAKLVSLGYIYKSEDETDSRAYKLYLTEKAKVLLPKIREEIHKMVALITENLTEEEKHITMDSLKKILSNLKSLKV